MKQASKKIIENNIQEILGDIKTKVLNKFDLNDVNIHSISFSSHDGHCPPGQSWVCQSLGIDPITHKPIIKCACVPDDQAENKDV